jgi:hypothetical protein
MPAHKIPVIDRFWTKVNKTDNCWLWTGSTTSKDRSVVYGRFQYATRTTRAAHRVAWELTRGPIPGDLLVLHRCDVGLCVNPDHLFLGTTLDNVLDKERKGRSNHHRGPRGTHCKHGHELTPESTRQRKDGSRSCRACSRAAAQRYYWKNPERARAAAAARYRRASCHRLQRAA